jgi:Fe-S cluster assembly ATP-binding protein
MLQLTGVELVLGGRKILHDVDLELGETEVHSILGMNGTGKSTLASVIMGLNGYAPTAGRVLFCGEDITAFSISERAQRGITLAWQEPARFEGLTVAEYLATGRQAARNSPLTPQECLAKVGLHPLMYLARAVDTTLSGGERRRIELAAVLAMSPRLAILDEPDSGIDPPSIDNIVDVIRTLSRRGAAVLLITHHGEVAAIADRASALCAGTILKTGNPSTITRFFHDHCKECLHINQPIGKELNNA